MMVPVDTTSQWKDEWQSVSVVNSDPTIQLPGFDLCRSTYMVNIEPFPLDQGRCAANLYKWLNGQRMSD